MNTNDHLLIIGIVVILLAVGLSGCNELFGEGGTIYAEKMNEKPEKFINISEQQMEQFPHLKLAINQTDSHIEPPTDEWNELRDFLGETYAYIHYQSEYYYVRLFGIV